MRVLTKMAVRGNQLRTYHLNGKFTIYLRQESAFLQLIQYGLRLYFGRFLPEFVCNQLRL